MARHARLLGRPSRRGRWRCATSASTPRGTSPAIRSVAKLRRRFANISTLAELDDLIAPLDPTIALVAGRRADPPRPHQRPDPGRPARWLPRPSRRRHGARRLARDGAQRRMTDGRSGVGLAAPTRAAVADRCSVRGPRSRHRRVARRRRGPGRLRAPAGDRRRRPRSHAAPDELVIAADTTVDLDSAILGKPDDDA